MDAAVNLVGILHQSRRQPFEKVHVELPRRLARACRAAGVRRLVHMSALHAGRDGPSQYLRSRGRGEDALREEGAGLAVTILKPSVIFGEDDSFLNLFAGLVKPLPGGPPRGRAHEIPAGLGRRRRAGGRRRASTIREPAGSPSISAGRAPTRSREIVHFVAGLQGRRRIVVPLPGWAALAQAFVLEHLPGPVMTRDNLASMKVDSVCGCPFPGVFGFAPAAMEAIVPDYMAAGRPARPVRALPAPPREVTWRT